MERARRRILRAMASVPLFYKLLIANSLIVIAGAAAGTMITTEYVRAQPASSTLELVGVFAALGTVISVVVNVFILRVALAPVHELEQAATAVSAGDLEARAPASPLADRDFRRLTSTFNEMLDRAREDRRRLRRLASEATRAAEAERRRIAQELHDDTAQRLAALLVGLRLVENATDAADRHRLLADARDQLSDALKQVRLIALALRPEALEDMGLGPAIMHHARQIEGEHGARVVVDPLPADARLSDDAQLTLYRIVQEALANAGRHADAETVRVRFSLKDGWLVTVIEDDGRGFDVKAALRRKERLGLFGMMERASYMGGEVTIDSMPARGTRIHVTLPLESAAHD